MPQIHEITTYLETIAPRSYQESYDNAGLITGNPQSEVSGILVSLDVIESIVDEALEHDCNLIVAHHPIIFKGLKGLTGRNYIERTIIKAIKHDIAIYAIHTNLDNVYNGVNAKIAEKLELQQTRVLIPKSQTLRKLTTFVPQENAKAVLNALSAAGAGNIGNYQNCSFQVSGTGTFQPNEQANPHIGEADKLEQVEEQRIEVILPAHQSSLVLQALRKAHPYEEVAYYLHNLENENQEVGSGMIGQLAKAMSPTNFLSYLKKQMNLSVIRHTALLDRPVQTVAVCGGAGSFLLPQAIRQQADVFVTADFKYHEFFDADGHLIIADIGHYESEVYTKELIQEFLCEKFVNFAVRLAKANTNPVFYI
ncbi:MAG: Nif3-like dinuclear metal center hexameric protein [Tunicatimonas sp.]|uniref:Nif3-like dinuclear metal center hexameric protein n=1 Tax=Tunicatimonas sp. TaxID=1940096 RepID=UPI003C759FC9